MMINIQWVELPFAILGVIFLVGIITLALDPYT
jgi:hypothetical protein